MFLLSLQSFGFRALLFFPGILFDPCLLSALFFFVLRWLWFPDQFVFEAIYVVWYSGQAGGEKQLTSVSSCSVSTIGVVVVDVSGDSTAMFQLWSSVSISGHVLPSWFCSHVPSCSLVLRSRCFSVKMSTFAVSDQTVHHCSVSACSSSQSALSAQRYSQGRQWLSHRLNLLVSRPPWPVFWVCAWLDRHGIRPSYLGLGGPPLLGLGVRPPRSVSHLYPLLTLMLRVLRC